MEKKDIIDWVLESGFEPAGLNTYEAPYEDMRVRIVFGHKFVSSFLIRGGEAEILVKARPEMIDIDSNGMIHGAGLKSSFVSRMQRGGAVPCWFPIRHAADVIQQISGNVREREIGMRWPDIGAWAVANGFEYVHKSLLKCEFAETTVSLKLLRHTLAAHVSSPDEDRYLGVANYDDLFVDEKGILRGVGLRDGFINQAINGELSPPWFSADFVESLRTLSDGSFGIRR